MTAVIFFFFLQLGRDENVALKGMVSSLKTIRKPGESTRVDSFSLSSLFHCNVNNYLMYWGSADENRKAKPILWMISLEPVLINESQVCEIRSNYTS